MKIKEKIFRQKLLYAWLIVFLWLPYSSYAQSIRRQAISSFGSVVLTADNILISQTAGQSYSTATTESVNNIAALQGFQQPVTLVVEKMKPFSMDDLAVRVFPNPASYTISILSDAEIETAYIQVFSINGKIIFNEIVSNLQTHHINYESWANGIYLIRISDVKHHLSKTIKLIISK